MTGHLLAEHCAVWDEAANRLHAQTVLLTRLLEQG